MNNSSNFLSQYIHLVLQLLGYPFYTIHLLNILTTEINIKPNEHNLIYYKYLSYNHNINII